MNAIDRTSTALSRRSFLAIGLSAAGGLMIGGFIPDAAHALDIADQPWAGTATEGEINAWILIEPDDTVIIRVAQSEMGEGIFTALPMIVAEELGCDWAKVKPEYASASRNLRENTVYKRMGTGGSGAVRRSREFLQAAGANARERLVQAAAARWQVPAESCSVDAGKVLHQASNRSLRFGELAGEAAKVTLAKEPAIKTPEQFTLIGKPLARLDTPPKLTGAAKYGIDIRLPDMVYAAVVTCPVFGGRVKSHDETAIKGRRGILALVPIEGGLAVVADRFWRAKEAALALPVIWEEGPAAETDSKGFDADYVAALDGPAVTARKEGDVEASLARGKRVDALYQAPHLAHAPMEPLNCTAHVHDGKVEVWMGTQNPDMALQLAAKAAGVAPSEVEIHNCFLGGGFGRRAVNDELVQAVTVSKAVGKPVKLVWTREEDMHHDRYRPQAAIRFQASLGEDGLPAAIHVRTAVGSIQRSLGWGKVENGVEPSAVEGLANMPYRTGAAQIDCILKNTHVPVMFWRSVGSSQNAFALESFIDEMAQASGQDPYRFRRKLLEGKPDFLAVLDTLAEKSDWGKPLPKGRGRGIAIHESFGTIVGEVVELAVSPQGEVKVQRVVAAVDCGHVVNPLTVEMQIESAVVYGLSAALFGEITIEKGAVVQGNFDDYQVARLADTPPIETHLVLSGGKKWGGIGEPGTPPIAPAVCNAIFAATGKRIRSLPVKNTDLKWGPV
ncbi:xanthine dehydrogenase family protein molybdopterin-binding subunit [Labrys sp. ZIDIC5]|uniref:xanthine dehydrogenase family protein molybdopterin-binding subunit n=1 Tax=Labrys sedimenti TaxID=3106036 RepID=UPI002ACAA85E|nr:xanthine dehydrogenase family protein molybdopterin-binding subunit [Labrys sp. ZIDIC5]MDZ5449343.1 xanthine dehydrogenase family protein molybdopterin-binding subunit [Labrys sp. ZIDIC5]